MGRLLRFLSPPSEREHARPRGNSGLLHALALEGPSPHALRPALERFRVKHGALGVAWVVPHGVSPLVVAAPGGEAAFGTLAKRREDALAAAARQGRTPRFQEAAGKRVIRVLPVGYGERVGYLMILVPARHPFAKDEGAFRKQAGLLRPALRLALALARPEREAARRPFDASLAVSVALHRLAADLKDALLWVSVPPEAVVLADGGVFTAALETLLKRAIARARPGTAVRLRAKRVGDHWGFVAETPEPAGVSLLPAPESWASREAGACWLAGPDFETLLWPAAAPAPKLAPAGGRPLS